MTRKPTKGRRARDVVGTLGSEGYMTVTLTTKRAKAKVPTKGRKARPKPARKPPDATQGLRDLVTNLKIESAQLAKSKTPVGQAGGTWLSRVARELEALLPSLESVPPQPRESELGNLKTARELDGYTLAGIADQTMFRCDANTLAAHWQQFADHINRYTSQAVAQARVDEAEWWAAGNHDKCGPECSLGRRLSGLKRDLAAIAKEPVK